MSPEAKFPQALLECAAVVRFVAEHGAEWGLDPDAHLPRRRFGRRQPGAGDRACCCATPAARRCEGMLANYPVSDARFDTPSYREFGAGGYGLSTERMAFYWNVYVPHEIDRLHPLAAPLRADLTGLPPVMVLLAELDVLRSEGEALVAKLRASGVRGGVRKHSPAPCTGSCARPDRCRRRGMRWRMAGGWMKRLAAA